MSAKGEYYPVGSNTFVPNLQYAADVALEGPLLVDMTPVAAPVAASATGILNAQSIATAGNTSTFVTTFLQNDSQMGKFGRCLQYVASGAATSTVTVQGFDYLGQPMTEQITLNGTTIVNGTKAFRRVTNIAFGATAATTINVGWRDVFGLPYSYLDAGADYTDGVRSGTQGTYTARVVAAQTITSSDPRGLFAPHSSVAPNGSRRYLVTYLPWRPALHGNRHFFS